MKLLAAPLIAATCLFGSQAVAQTTTSTAAEIACDLGGACPAAAAAVEEPGDPTPVTGIVRGVTDYFGTIGPRSAAPPSSRSNKPKGANSGFTPPSHVGTAIAGRGRPHSATSSTPGRRSLQIEFDNGSADLSDSAKGEVQKFATALTTDAALSGKRFAVEGYTNSVGARTANLDLSRRRAQAVADYLGTLGVAVDRLDTRGFGPDRPLLPARPADGANRRVEIVKL